MPKFYLPETVNLGGATLAHNILTNAKRIADKIKAGKKVTEAERKTQGVEELLGGKYTLFSPFKKKTKNPVPLSLRLVGAMERMLSSYGTFSRTNPVFAAVIEGSSALGATLMAERAEEAYPERSGPRLGAELIGAAGPSILLPKLGSKYIPAIGRVVKDSTYTPFTQGGLPKVWSDNFEQVKKLGGILKGKSEKRTSKNIYKQLLKPENFPDGKVPTTEEFLKIFGEDGLLEAKTIAQRESILGRPMTALEKEQFKNRINWTAAEAVSGTKYEPIIAALQGAAEATSTKLAAKRVGQQELLNDNYTTVIQKLVETGDPSLIKIAAEMSFDSFETGHAARIEDAVNEVMVAFEKVKGKDPSTNQELGIKLYETIDNLLKNARKTEKSLWTVLDNVQLTEFRNKKGKRISEPNFITAWEDALPRVEEASNYAINQLKPLNDFVERIGKELEEGTASITLQDLREMRSLALSMSRDKNTQPQIQRLAGIFAESLYDDMSSLPQGSLFTYDAAVAYSRALNDTFTRTFSGPLNMKNRGTGAIRIPPEIMGARLMSGTSDTALLRQSELEHVYEFARAQNLEGFEDDIVTLNNVRDGLLRNMLTKKVLILQTNEINLPALNRWLEDPVNQEFLSLPVFKSLKDDLNDATTAQSLLVTLQNRKTQELKDLKKSTSFLNFLPQNLLPDGVKGSESPAKIMGNAIEGDFPVNALNNILAFVNGGKTRTVAGVEITGLPDLNRKDRVAARDAIKSAILEHSFLKSDVTGPFSPTVMYQSIFDPMKNTGLRRPGKNIGGVSLSDWMTANKIISPKELKNIKNMLGEMVKYEAMDQAGKLTDDILKTDTNAALDLYIRLAGSKLGATAAGTLGAGADSLIVRSAGVRFLQTILQDMPKSMDMAFAGRLFEDPELMAAMVRAAGANNKSSAQKKTIGSRLIDLLSFYGFRESFPLLGSKSREAVETIVEPTIEKIEETFTGEKTNENIGPSSSVVSNQDELRTSFLQRPKGPASGLGQSGGSPPTANSVDRARFAALFPEDRDLIGIGSLMS